MKNFISILTATAAGLVAVGSASAADLPSKKAAPAQYVKVCDAFGAGYFYIPGGDTCLKLSGYVRAEYRYRTNALPADNSVAFRARGLVGFEAKTKTSYGDLRSFLQLRITEDTGQAGPASILNNAFVEWAGITAGRKSNSFFDFYTQEYEFLGVSSDSTQFADVLAYTAKFGSGMSATVSLENPTWRMQGANGGLVLGSVAPASKIGYTANGNRMPDVVANLRGEGTWGSAQLSAVAHQNNAALAAANVSKIGYAIQAGAKINLPMLAAGDSFVVQATYAKGATEYLASDTFTSVWGKGVHQAVGDQSAIATSTTTLGLVSAYGGVVAINHFWAPSLQQSVYASYAVVKNPALAAVGASGFVDQKDLVIGTRLAWSPVANLVIGPEVVYENVKSKKSANSTSAPALANASDVRFDFRIQRNF